jgi:hypothetical protein
MTAPTRRLRHRQSGRSFLIALIVTTIFLVIMGAFFGTQIRQRDYLLSRIAKRRALLEARSAGALMLHELLDKPDEKRWNEGWTVSGDRFIYTDIDGTRYASRLEVSGTPPRTVIRSEGEYRGFRSRITRILKPASPPIEKQ